MTQKPTGPYISIEINVAGYRDRFISEIATHIADLNQALKALRDGTFVANAIQHKNVQGVTVGYTHPNVAAGAERRHVETCFRAVIGAFITFLDRMIAIQNLSSDIPFERNLDSDAALGYVEEYIDRKILEVARDTKLKNPGKLDRFAGLQPWSKDAATSFFALRRCLEHHDGIPDQDIKLKWKALRIFCNDKEIDGLPYRINAGETLNMRMVEMTKTLPKSQRVQVSEQELRDILTTLEHVISTEIVQIVVASKTAGTSASAP